MSKSVIFVRNAAAANGLRLGALWIEEEANRMTDEADRAALHEWVAKIRAAADYIERQK